MLLFRNLIGADAAKGQEDYLKTDADAAASQEDDLLKDSSLAASTENLRATPTRAPMVNNVVGEQTNTKSEEKLKRVSAVSSKESERSKLPQDPATNATDNAVLEEVTLSKVEKDNDKQHSPTPIATGGVHA